MHGRGRPARWLAASAALVATAAACGVVGEGTTAGTEVAPSPDERLAGEGIAVERVIDGDSLEVSVNGQVLEVRLVGINAPELTTLSGGDSCLGAAARDELRMLLDDRALTIRPDGEDRFGRLLADIEADGVSVGDSMVGAGWALALWSAEDAESTGRMRQAAGSGLGLWGQACGTAAAGLVISGHRVDAPGDDRRNLAEEWVEVTNTAATTFDLDGWTIRDETTSNRFLISGLVLDGGASVRFRTGRGRSSGTDYYLGQDFPVWSNRGETVLLVDPAGLIAAHAFIDGGR